VKISTWSRILLLVFALSPLAANSAPLTLRWLGVAGVSITDGKNTLLFDPVFTKPSLSHWIFGKPFRSDPKRVTSGLEAANIVKADAVFSSHEHFDHSVDVAQIAVQTGASVYGGISLKRLTQADSSLNTRFEMISAETPIQIGDFKVIPYSRAHAPILHGIDWKFLPGEVSDSFHFEFYGYREGETWGYRIEHPNGNLLLDQGSHSFPANLRYAGKTDVYLVGVANKKSFEDLVEKNIKAIGARFVIPLHFDVFFLQSELLESKALPSSELDRIANYFERNINNSKFLVPSRFQPIPLSPSISAPQNSEYPTKKI